MRLKPSFSAVKQGRSGEYLMMQRPSSICRDYRKSMNQQEDSVDAQKEVDLWSSKVRWLQ